ncbi:hypothetical protein ACJJTC_009702 [Scirpophaga incertulas]
MYATRTATEKLICYLINTDNILNPTAKSYTAICDNSWVAPIINPLSEVRTRFTEGHTPRSRDCLPVIARFSKLSQTRPAVDMFRELTAVPSNHCTGLRACLFILNDNKGPVRVGRSNIRSILKTPSAEQPDELRAETANKGSWPPAAL